MRHVGWGLISLSWALSQAGMTAHRGQWYSCRGLFVSRYVDTGTYVSSIGGLQQQPVKLMLT